MGGVSINSSKFPGVFGLRLNFKAIGLLLAASILSNSVQGQSVPKQPGNLPSCNRDNAETILHDQITRTRTFDDTVKRIAVLNRAADMLWPYQNDKARAAFLEAFDLASVDFKEKGDEPRREGVGLVSRTPDQRYTVINAIAKRDLAWARKLTDEMLKDQQKEVEEAGAKDPRQEQRVAEKLLGIASSLLPSDQTAALSFAASSLRYPATLYLPLFLYKLADVNRAAADQFYQEALIAYGNAPMERFLYLSSYPFGNDREVGDMPGYTIYKVPNGFTPHQGLQRLFVQAFLRQVQKFIQNPSEDSSGSRVSESGQMWLALTRLEGQISQSLPDLAPTWTQAQTNLAALLPQNVQLKMGQIINSQRQPPRTFAEQIEAAESNPNVDRRNQQLVAAVISAAREELDSVLKAVDRISDSDVRTQLLNWLHFNRTQSAIKDKALDEARKFASKVGELDQRAYLYSQIAEETLKHDIDQTLAREMLEEVVTAATRAPATMVTARALLSAAYLYSKIDLNRAIAVLADAIKLVNRVEDPDFSRQFVTRRIEGKTFGIYAAFQTPGFSLENTLREIGKKDFDGSLYQASNLADKSLQSLTTLALLEPCLEHVPQQATPLKTKKNEP